MIYDCIIIGGGPAGLNAALVLGRAKRNVAIMDNGQPRNRVTHESHGYLTRDRIQPAEFRRIAYDEVLRYPSVQHYESEVQIVQPHSDGHFTVHTRTGEVFEARKILIATGLRERFPELPGLQNCYGSSIFNCPFCDGWEMKDEALAVIAGPAGVMHLTKMLSSWNRDLVVFTNGLQVLEDEQFTQLSQRNIPVYTEKITRLHHTGGKLNAVELENGQLVERSGGFIVPELELKADFQDTLGYNLLDHGGIQVDENNETTAKGVYCAGDSTMNGSFQLILAAAAGSRTGAIIHAKLLEESWAKEEEMLSSNN